MEPAGVVLGTIALVGLLENCITLFSYISAAQSLGDDCRLMNTKLDIERTLLLQWADRVRLLNDDQDYRLHDPNTREIVGRILNELSTLLSKGNDLRERYGFRNENAGNIEASESPLSERRLIKFDNARVRLELRHKILGKTDSSSKHRLRWVAHDRNKFDLLISSISYFVTKLNDLVPLAPSHQNQMTKQDLEHVRESTLRSIIEASTGAKPSLAEVAEETLREKRILNRLRFRFMDDRLESLSSEHPRSLQWALQPPETGSTWDDLSAWLQHGENIYWISGKAGSGKSVLMKYLYNSSMTAELLKYWAGDCSLHLANFFFWALAPTMEQKSQDGLSRALLHSILSSDPSLVSVLLPGMWNDAQGNDKLDITPPSLAETKKAFKILDQLPNHTQKYCFFIDGLDEYYGNLNAGITFVKEIISGSKFKILLSSRPTSHCTNAFSRCPSLQMQDLNEEDIKKYIHDTLRGHTHVAALQEIYPTSIESLMSELLEKASGVFLWVVLACRSVIQGLNDCDSISNLRHRIDELPPELEDLFKHMLNSIEPRHKTEAVKYLLRRYHWEAFRISAALATNLPSLGLALLDEEDSLPTSHKRMDRISVPERRTRVKILEARLRSRCWGLLELRKPRQRSAGTTVTEAKCFCGSTNGHHDVTIDSTVDFLHLSVFQFLSTAGTLDLEVFHPQGPSFDPVADLACLCWYWAQVLVYYNSGAAVAYGRSLFYFCRHARPRSYTSLSSVMSRVHELTHLWNALHTSRSQLSGPLFKLLSDAEHDVRLQKTFGYLLAIEAGIDAITDVICSGKWPLKSPLSEPDCYPLLYHTLRKPLLGPHLSPKDLQTSVPIVRSLIASGCDPNEVFHNENGSQTTPWRWWSDVLNPGTSYTSCDSVSVRADLLEVFVQGGADLDQMDMMIGSHFQELRTVTHDIRNTQSLRKLRPEAGDATGQSDHGQGHRAVLVDILQRLDIRKRKDPWQRV